MIPKRYRDKAMRIYCDYFAKQRKSGEFITEAFSVQKLYDYGFPRKADAEETTHVLAAMGYLSVHTTLKFPVTNGVCGGLIVCVVLPLVSV